METTNETPPPAHQKPLTFEFPESDVGKCRCTSGCTRSSTRTMRARSARTRQDRALLGDVVEAGHRWSPVLGECGRRGPRSRDAPVRLRDPPEPEFLDGHARN
jgi:hypothetical protein